MLTTTIIAEYRRGMTSAILERVNGVDYGKQYRVTYCHRCNALEKAQNEFLTFLPPSQHEAYEKQIADYHFAKQNKA